MSGGGDGGPNYSEPGWATNILVPAMKAIGLGIASKGGALGPMLASGGDAIEGYHRDRRDQAVSDNLLKLLQPMLRSESTPGLPARFSEGGAAARAGTPEAETPPDIAGTPGTRREWTGMPTQAEVLARITGGDVPANLRPFVGREALRLRLPTDVERPQAVTEELERARESETRARREPIFTEALSPQATPAARARAMTEGHSIGEPPPPTKYIQRHDGTLQEVDSRTGEPKGPPREQRSVEEQTQREQTQALIPQYEQQFDEAVKRGIYTAPEAQLGRQLLARAKITGDPGPFLTFAGQVVKAREDAAKAKLQHPGTGPKTTETTKPIQINDQNRAGYQKAVSDVVARLSQLGALKDDKLPYAVRNDGQKVPKTRVIEEAYSIAHPGERIRVEWDPNAGESGGYFSGPKGQFVPVRAWEILERTEHRGAPESTEDQ